MRKLAAYGAAALLAISAGVGVSFAQDSTPAATATEVAAPASQAVMPTARPWLGVGVSDDGAGVTITQVSANSPAETAQLQAGDVILSVNGTAVETISDLQAAIDGAASGDVLTLAVERGTEQMSIDVTLASRPGRGMMALPSDPLQAASRALQAELTAVDDGYQVVSLSDRNPFQLAVGDVITEINGEAISSIDWATLLAPTSADSTITLTVTRDGATTTLEAQLPHFGGHGGQFDGNGQPGGNRPGGNGGPGGNPPDGSGQPGTNGLPGGNPPAGQPGDNGANGGAI